MTATKKCKLVNKIYAIGIHSVTGQEIDEGYLMPGTLIRNVREHGEHDEGIIYRFEACTDGKLWYKQESYSKPETN